MCGFSKLPVVWIEAAYFAGQCFILRTVHRHATEKSRKWKHLYSKLHYRVSKGGWCKVLYPFLCFAIHLKIMYIQNYEIVDIPLNAQVAHI